MSEFPGQVDQDDGIDAPPAEVLPTVTVIQEADELTFGRDPVEMVCPNCNTNITTKTSSKPGTGSYTLACLLSIHISIICCGCLFPLLCCCKEMHDVTHKCPNCDQQVGFKKGDPYTSKKKRRH